MMIETQSVQVIVALMTTTSALTFQICSTMTDGNVPSKVELHFLFRGICLHVASCALERYQSTKALVITGTH